MGFPATREIWESVVAMPVFSGNELVELTLHPISLGFSEPRQDRGRPRLADPRLSEKILSDLQRLSKPMGTQIDLVDGVGVVRMRGSATQ